MKTIALLIVCAALTYPATAAASWAPYIPPGNSGANQYVESVPSASGNHSAGAVRNHRPTSSSALAAQPGPVTAVTQAALLAQGRAGRLTAQLASTTGPRGLTPQTAAPRKHKAKTSVGGTANPGGPSAGGGSAPGGGGSSAVGSVAGALTGTGGVSGVLPFVLAATALAIAAIAVLRRRLN